MLIEQELAAAQAAQQDGNHGKARVCARRAVALATEAWLARLPHPPWHGDAMEHLRRIQQDASLPLPIRRAAERLSTPVTRQHTDPFTTDPIADARLIIAHLGSRTSDDDPR
jgi:HEPN domain-containing protein